MIYTKSIIYDPITRDFAGSINGQIKGFYRTYLDAELALDNMILRYLTRI